MTTSVAAVAQMPTELSAENKHSILENVLSALRKRFYSPEKLNRDWQAAVQRHRAKIESAPTADAFEQAVSDLLKELNSSHLGFFHQSARRASSRAALSATYLADETAYGKRWIFQDVHSGGAAAIAGIEPGNILLTVNGEEIIPPEHPVFPMGKQTNVELIDNQENRRMVMVDVAKPKGKKLHFIEPTLVEARRLKEGIGYLKIAMFPGMVGVVVANQITDAVHSLGAVDRLIIDLRGNTGGGIGALRVMSLLTSERIPVGFALDKRRTTGDLNHERLSFPRFSRIPSNTKALWPLALRFAPAMLTKKPIVLETEGLAPQQFHGRIVLLVDRHTASAAEMIVAFARENNLATIVGEKTAGRLLSATSVKVGNGFRLALPTGAYHTWRGSVLEGTPIEPDRLVEFDWRDRRRGNDGQLNFAIECLQTFSKAG
ncbi:S41 family peptidase [Occallatibacter riparius]|uniref:S41 family peptidase n=1 Tax=Occallatibacter riparius TaxID=1002689 RepID=A0A9J7BKM9_9BACT|nr:S41 family peptidase [Occallatibacter riparius]UWZ81821.1 S41 family peptidase [Occallatibacter riparius]